MPVDTLLHIGIVVVMSGAITPPQLNAMKREASQIWRVHGIELSWCERARDQCASGAHVDLMLRVRSGDRGVIRGRSSDGESLGSIRFTTSTPDRNISLALDAIERIVFESMIAGMPIGRWPDAIRDRLLGRALGRVLAHEIGHFVLGLPSHAATGMMRAWFTAHDLTSPDRRQWTIGKPLLVRLNARLDILRAIVSGEE